jgi:hypothetical protein
MRTIEMGGQSHLYDTAISYYIVPLRWVIDSDERTQYRHRFQYPIRVSDETRSDITQEDADSSFACVIDGDKIRKLFIITNSSKKTSEGTISNANKNRRINKVPSFISENGNLSRKEISQSTPNEIQAITFGNQVYPYQPEQNYHYPHPNQDQIPHHISTGGQIRA